MRYGEGEICSGFLIRRLSLQVEEAGVLGENCVRAIRTCLLLARTVGSRARACVRTAARALVASA